MQDIVSRRHPVHSGWIKLTLVWAFFCIFTGAKGVGNSLCRASDPQHRFKSRSFSCAVGIEWPSEAGRNNAKESNIKHRSSPDTVKLKAASTTMSRIFLFLVVFLRPGATDTLGVIVTSSNLKTSNRTADGIVDHADMPVGRLSEFGKRVKTVVIAALQPGGVCKHGNGDWRATLPRYIARSLGSQAKVLIWEAQVAARHEGLLHDCRVCDETESPAELTMFSCFDWFSAGSVREADLVLVLGSGYRTCKSCIPKIRRWGAEDLPILHHSNEICCSIPSSSNQPPCLSLLSPFCLRAASHYPQPPSFPMDQPASLQL